MTTDKPLNTLNPNGFLRLKDVLRLFPVSKSTWWLGVQQGRFPKPVKLSTRISAWRVSDIQNLLEKTARHNALAKQDSSWEDTTHSGLNSDKNNS